MLLVRIGFSLLWAGAGTYLTLALLRLIQRRREWNARGVVTEGEVVAFKTESGSTSRSGRTTYFMPVVDFLTPAGASVRFVSSRGENPNPYVVGQKVQVRYFPDNPRDADLDSATRGWFVFIALLVAIAVCFTVASLPLILKPPAS